MIAYYIKYILETNIWISFQMFNVYSYEADVRFVFT